MTFTERIKLSTVTRKSRILVLSVMGIASILMFGLAYTASAATLYRQLEIGMSGSDVSDLQIFLATDSTIYPQGLVTGYFGLLTQAAVSKFQSRNGIVTVGRVGPITMAAINAQMSGGSMGFDRSAPLIYSVSVNPSSTGATINWTTSENAATIVYYNTSPLSMVEASVGSQVTVSGSTLVNTDMRTSHSANLTGLQSDTLYHYVVYVRDGSSNTSITWPSTFKTRN